MKTLTGIFPEPIYIFNLNRDFSKKEKQVEETPITEDCNKEGFDEDFQKVRPRKLVLECGERAHSRENFKVLVHFLSGNLEEPVPPSTLVIFPKSTNKNFEIATLFSIVEKHTTMFLG